MKWSAGAPCPRVCAIAAPTALAKGRDHHACCLLAARARLLGRLPNASGLEGLPVRQSKAMH